MLYIYPYKPDKKTFDENKDELGQWNKGEKHKKETKEEFTRKMNDKLEQEWFNMYSDFGLLHDFRHRLVKNYENLENKFGLG